MITTEEMIAVMTAYKEGKKIECRERNNERDTWEILISPEWNWHNYEYRVAQEPKYRPFANAEEVMEAIKEHGDWVRQGCDIYRRIDKVTTIGNNVCISLSGMKDWGINELPNIEKMRFLDGAPFGKLEDKQ